MSAISPSHANKVRVVFISENANLTAKFDDAELIQANIYYVRTDGDDDNPGTENSSSGAWATIQHAADTANPSDLVLVEPGTYDEQVVITRSGLANQLITFHADGEVIIDGESTNPYGFKLDGASYIKIDGFTVRNAGSIGIFLVNASDHNVISNNTCYSNGSTATSALGDRPCGIYLYTSCNYNIIEANTCRNNTSSGIWLEGSSSYCTVKNNKSYSNGYGGIIVAGATDYNTVSYNLIYSNGQLGMDVSYGAHDNTIADNTIYNNGATGISSNNYGASNYIKNNIIVNNGQNYSWAYGITMDSNSTAALSYNDVYNNGQGGLKNYSGISAGVGDISLDPLFKSTDPESPDILKLQSLANSDANESPCIDSGSPSDTSSIPGNRIDMGAYDLYQHDPVQGGLTGEYFDNSDFTGLKVVRIDPRINFDWGNYSPDASIAPTTFSARWTGKVKVDFADSYTFYLTTDDGSRLWIDGQLIINEWYDHGPSDHQATVYLNPGLHVIQYDYYNDTGWAIAKLFWSTSSTNKTIIPSDHLYYSGKLPQPGYNQGGLKGVYSKYTNLWGPTSYVLTRIDPDINFDWGENMPDAALGNDLYTAKWKGKVRTDTADTYTFYTTSDDGCRLWVNGQVLVDDWQYQGATEHQGSVYLSPGLYDIEMDYFEGTGSAVCKLLWSSTAIAKSVVPSTNLYYKNDDNSTGGLLAEYYDNQDLTSLKIRRIDPNVDFDWLTFYPDSSIEGSTYSIRWSGQVLADYAETYTFYANSDDGLKLWVDNNLLIDTWYDHGVGETSATVTLSPGWHDIKVEYYQGTGYATAKLSYSSASTPKTAIPQDHLRTTLSTEDASLNLHCSLDSATAIQTPATTGHSGSIIQTGTGTVNFVPAKFSNGVYLSGSDSSNMGLVEFSSADLNKKQGEIEFWFKPAWNSDDNVWHHLFSTNWSWDSCIEIFKHSDNALYFKITKDGVQHGIVADMTGKWTANTWHHLAASYGPAGMKFYLDYQQIAPDWTFNSEPAYTGTLPDTFNSDIFVGGGGEGGVPSNAVFDELKIYNQQITPSDTTAPIIAITSHQDNQTVNSSPVTVSGTIDDNLAQVTINTIQANVSEGTFSASVPLSLGSNTITVSATDQANNNSTTTIHLVFADNTPPTTPTVTDDGAYNISSGQLHASWTACSDAESGINRYEYAIGTTSGGTDIVNWTSVGLNTEVTKTGLSLTEGQEYYFSVAAINNANGSSVGYSDGITLDSGAPSGAIAINNNAQYTNSTTVTLTLSATDTGSGLSQMKFSSDGTTWSSSESYSTSKSWTLATGDGSKTVYAEFKDVAGNWSSAVSNTITLDTTAPTQPTIDTVSSPTNANSQTVTGTKTEDTTAIIVTCSTATVGTVTYPTSTTWSCQLTNLTEGDNNISVIAKDAVENPSTPASTTITYQPNATLSIAITSPPNNVYVNTSPITVSGTVSDTTATVVVNSTSATVIDNNFTAPNISLTVGTHPITAQATKGAQSAQDVKTITYDPNFYCTEIFDDFDGIDKRVEMWWDSDGTAVYNRSFDHDVFHSGFTSMKVQYSKQGHPSSFFAVEPTSRDGGNDFSKYNKFSFWIYTQDPSLTMTVKFLDTDGHSWQQNFSSSAQGLWQRIVCDFSSFPSNFDLTHISNIEFTVAPNDGAATGTFYMDDLSLHSSKPYFYPPLVKPTLTGPTEAAYDTYQLNGTVVPGATIYELCESTSSSFEDNSSFHYLSNSPVWNFGSRILPTTYYYKVRGWSNIPEEGGVAGDWSDPIVVEIMDKIPAISSVTSSVNTDTGNSYAAGSIVRISITEQYSAPDIVSGNVRITSASQGYDSGLKSVSKDPAGALYTYNWCTSGLHAANDYVVTATLTDVAGQTSAPNTSLTVHLVLENAPRCAEHLETDFSIPARGIPIKFERYYGSGMNHPTPMGYNWTHNYYMHITELNDSNVTLWDEKDFFIYFVKNSDGSYTGPPGKNYVLTKPADNIFTFRRPDNITYTFAMYRTFGELYPPAPIYQPGHEVLVALSIPKTNLYQLTSIENLNGNRVTLNYGGVIFNNEPLLSSVTDDSGRQVLTFEYYSSGKIKTITDFDGRSVGYQYNPNGNGNLKQFTDQAGQVTTYTYGFNGNSPLLDTITNPRGYHTYFTYAGTGHNLLSECKDNNINYTSYSLQTSPNRIITTDARAHATSYINTDATHYSIVDALGNTTVITSDDQDNPLSVTNAYNKTSSYTWDGYGNKLTETDPYGNITHYAYEPSIHKVTSRTDANDNLTTFIYDDKGNLLEMKDPYNKTITMAYDSYGQIVQSTDKNGNITAYEYNSTGGITKITRQMGSSPDPDVDLIVTMQYNSSGNLSVLTDPRGDSTTFDYDDLDRRIRITDALGNKTEYAYDGNDNVTQVVYKDSSGTVLQTITKTYDEADRLKTVTDNLNNTTTYDYDLVGNVTKITDALGKITTFTYDERNLLATKTDDDENETIYTYNNVGKLSSIEDANGHITSYSYDDANRLTATTYPNLSQDVIDQYDNVGNILREINRAGQPICHTYDNLNRPHTKTYPDNSMVSYSYDDGSRLLSVIDANGTIAYSYDKADRFLSVTDVYNKVVTYEYDKAGNRTKLTYPDSTYITYVYDALDRLTNIKNAAGGDIAVHQYDALSRRTSLALENGTQTVYSYDVINRLTSLVNKKITPETILSSFGYSYDAVGNQKTRTIQEGTFNYDYNDIHELIQVKDPQNNITAYSYDGVRNRTSAEGHNYTTNNLNQYITDGLTNYTYDTKGNLTSDGTFTYTYDFENRNIMATDNLTTTASYTYDYSGRRISKAVNGVITKYTYDGADIITEYDSSNTLLQRNVFGRNIDEVLKRTDYTGLTPVDYYYHKDRLGSTVTVSDAQANIVEKYSYDAYGSVTIKDANDNVLSQSNINNRYLFTGREYDRETGLYYYRARMYSSRIGRFLQPDPIGYYDSANLYQYCHNSPINYIDPMGLRKQAIDAKILAALIALGFDVSGGLTVTEGGAIIVGGVAIGAEVAAAVVAGAAVGWTVKQIANFIKEHSKGSSKNKGGDRTPAKGEPGSTQSFPDPDGKGKTDRTYGPDGNAETDTDYGHDHNGSGDPHEHDWDWNNKKNPRGPAHPPKK